MKNVLNITSVLLVVVLILVVCCMKKNKENYKHWENLAPWPIWWRPYPSPKYGRSEMHTNVPKKFDLESKKISNRCHELTKLGCGLTASCPSKDMPGGSGWEAGSYPCAEEIRGVDLEGGRSKTVRNSYCNRNKGDGVVQESGKNRGRMNDQKVRTKYNYGWNKHTPHCGKDPSRNRGKKCAEWTKECKTQLDKEQDEYYAAERKKKTQEKMDWIKTQYNNTNTGLDMLPSAVDKNWECSESTKARDHLTKRHKWGLLAEGKFSIDLKNVSRKGCADACNNKKYYFQARSLHVGGTDYPTECKSFDYNTSSREHDAGYTCRLFSGRRQKDDGMPLGGMGMAEGKAYLWDYCVKKYDVTDNAYCTPGSLISTTKGPKSLYESYHSMTVDEATKKCNDDDNCKGFTMKKDRGAGPGPRQIIFKSKIDGNTPNSGYKCYVK